MAEYNFTFRLHHKGVFSKTEYSGGSVVTLENMDPDTFSYSVLMEWVKDLQYDEIGGIYVQNKDNDGWTLMTDDRSLFKHMYANARKEIDYFIDCDVDKGAAPMKQMQPHVIVRPRSSLFNAKEQNAEKRKYVTLKNIHDEKRRKMTSRKKLQFENTNAGPTKEGTTLPDAREEEETDGSGVKLGLSDYLKKFEVGGRANEPENAVEKQCETENEQSRKTTTGESQGCNEYEMNRNKRVAENKKKVAELGLKRMAAELSQNNKGKAKATRDQSESDNYIPDNEVEPESDEDDIVTSKKKKKVKKVVVGAGPTTRSRASKVTDSCDKQAHRGPVQENDSSTVPPREKLKNLKCKAPGSMAAYLELRELQKTQSEIELSESQSQAEHLQSQSQTDTPVEAPKRKRGKTKMNHVHSRTEKKIIMLNQLSQPVSDDTKSTCELSNFLGTVVRDFVSLTFTDWRQVPEKDLLWEYVTDKYQIPEEAKKWVLKGMGEHFRSYKSRMKKNHYTAYNTDEERLEHRPRNIPLQDFKILLKYWGDEDVQAIAKRNTEARSQVTDTHTAGPVSFAQICNKLVLERPQVDVDADQEQDEDREEGEQTPRPLSEADIFIATRKRDQKRTYKLPPDAVQKKIADAKTILDAGGSVEAANKIVRGDKKHSSSWLLGRFIRKKEPKEKPAITCGASDQYMAELTEKIRAELTQEMEEKVDKKVQEVMKKFAEKNPGLKFDIGESSVSTRDDSDTP